MESKKCSKCETIKSISDFHRDITTKDGFHNRCINCKKEYMTQYRENNKNYIKKYNKEYNKKWYEENKYKIKEYQKIYHKKYYNENKNKLNEYQNKCKMKYRKTNPQFRFRINFSRAIRLALKKQEISKRGYSWETILGYTIKNLIQHLEDQFIEGMEWDNYGKWHLDHIRPQSSFNFTSYEDEAFQECWSLNNLQPLWAQDNWEKSNKIPYLQR